MTRIAHIADVHIRNVKFHDVYRKCFDELYQSLRNNDIDIIYVAGDLAHTKTKLSPEYFELCSSFLDNLSDIAPTYVILGNHDGNLRALSRQDAVSPVVSALNKPNLRLIKDSEEVRITPDIVFNCLSVFDKENWISPTDKNKINIALYHGSVSGCSTDTGWVISKADEDLDSFAEFDYAMLGDIHKSNQSMDVEGKVRYAGSLIQQNHGEANDKGYLLWNVSSKDNFTVEHVKISNPSPYVTIELNDEGMVDDFHDIGIGAKLRLISYLELSLEERTRAIDDAKEIYRPEIVTFLNKAGKYESAERDLSSKTYKENLRDIEVQNRLIEEYLVDYELTKEELQQIFDLNEKYNTYIEENEDIARNVEWKLKSFQWDNFFNYGEGNKLDFQKLDGIVGVFGKNFSGKSSIIDSLLFTLFNKTTKNERKSVKFINDNKQSACGAVEVEIGDKVLTIERESEKYIKKLRGKETEEARTDVNFFIKDSATGEELELDGTSRGDTDKKIRRSLGTVDDFLFTSLSSQHGALNFIDEGETKRKELLAKFLDLVIFDQKFKLAKEDSLVHKMNLKKFKDYDFKSKIIGLRGEIRKNENITSQNKIKCSALESELSSLKTEIEAIKTEIEATPNDIIDIDLIENELERNFSKIASVTKTSLEAQATLDAEETIASKIEELLEKFDVDLYRKKQRQIELKQKNLEFLKRELEGVNRKIKIAEQRARLLEEVPCGDQFSTCKFIKDAFVEKKSIPELEVKREESERKKKLLEQEIENLEPRKVLERIDNCQKVLSKQARTQSAVRENKLILEKNRTIIQNLDIKTGQLVKKKEKYFEAKIAIEKLKLLTETKAQKESKKTKILNSLSSCKDRLMGLYQDKGSLEQKLDTVYEYKEDYKKASSDFKIYEMYMRCTHNNGISYNIIKKKLPILNEEITKILQNIVDFKIYFEEDGKRLNILLQHPNQSPRPISLGSGMEKTMGAMAIRLALLTISSLPKSDVIILDEPGTALDEENLEAFTRMLQEMKNYFKTIIMISHLESLKDCVDQEIVITNNDGFASVNI